MWSISPGFTLRNLMVDELKNLRLLGLTRAAITFAKAVLRNKTQNRITNRNDYLQNYQSYQGGCLRNHIERWKELSANQYIINIVTGSCLPFSEKPPLKCLTADLIKTFNTKTSPDMSKIIRGLIEEGILDFSFITGTIQIIIEASVEVAVFIRTEDEAEKRSMEPTSLLEDSWTRRGTTGRKQYRVIGAIDCTHIRVKKINADGGQLYINRKGFSSINVQVFCNVDLKIMDIVTRLRGSVHDSRIFRECRLKQRFEAGAFSGILLYDSGYPCTPYLFTPLLNPTTPQEERKDLFPGEEDNIEPSIQFAPSVTVEQGYFPSSVWGNIRRRQFIETHFQ
ncbi:hypothetical protein HF086_015216 [Spodoptera exigua]|uniref:DDE Tnp4 domain-containing protein n=1 Tax=Spodoptera exigua TaxID=7107 RepID=A0A922SJT2_SPOEX|nr:hypothetical protein HF086_015216 [Spodoptera exigua]